ncbi:MAG: pitrilysin family protein [Pseudomonadota bacterium]
MSVGVTTLANGIRVVTEAMPHLETVALGVWVGVGSRHETRAENGISHLLEHMAFKGTQRRSSHEIAAAIENVGGDINASTSLEQTAYYARVLRGDTALALDVLADILRNSVFEPDELVREKDVIEQEIAAALDTADDLVFDTAQALAFDGHSAGRSILGTPETLAAFDAEQLRRFLAEKYAPGRIVISAAGAIEHAEFAGQVEALFGDMPARDLAEDTLSPAEFVGGTRYETRQIEQTHLILGWPAPPLGDPAYYSAHVLSGVLGGGMSSRLFQRAREERGLCYSIYAYCWSLVDAGLFGVYAATSGEHVAGLHALIRSELAELAGEGPGDEELMRAKAQLKSGLLMGLESPSVRADQMARHLLCYGRVLTQRDLIETINAVSREDVRAVAGTIACGDRRLWSEVGPERDTGAILATHAHGTRTRGGTAPVGRGGKQTVAALRQ